MFLFMQKTAYEMRISDWSSDVCSSDLQAPECLKIVVGEILRAQPFLYERTDDQAIELVVEQREGCCMAKNRDRKIHALEGIEQRRHALFDLRPPAHASPKVVDKRQTKRRRGTLGRQLEPVRFTRRPQPVAVDQFAQHMFALFGRSEEN